MRSSSPKTSPSNKKSLLQETKGAEASTKRSPQVQITYHAPPLVLPPSPTSPHSPSRYSSSPPRGSFTWNIPSPVELFPSASFEEREDQNNPLKPIYRIIWKQPKKVQYQLHFTYNDGRQPDFITITNPVFRVVDGNIIGLRNFDWNPEEYQSEIVYSSVKLCVVKEKRLLSSIPLTEKFLPNDQEQIAGRWLRDPQAQIFFDPTDRISYNAFKNKFYSRELQETALLKRTENKLFQYEAIEDFIPFYDLIYYMARHRIIESEWGSDAADHGKNLLSTYDEPTRLHVIGDFLKFYHNHLASSSASQGSAEAARAEALKREIVATLQQERPLKFYNAAYEIAKHYGKDSGFLKIINDRELTLNPEKQGKYFRELSHRDFKKTTGFSPVASPRGPIEEATRAARSQMFV